MSKNEKGLMDTDNNVVIVGDRGQVEVEEGIKGINGNGKNTVKIKVKILVLVHKLLTISLNSILYR